MNTITINITEPMKMDFMNIDMNQLSILVGQNGSGKSFLLTINWVVHYMLNVTAAAMLGNVQMDMIEMAQFVSDSSFRSKITGCIWAHLEQGTVKVAYIDGKVINATVDGAENIKNPAMPRYASSAYRTFTAISMYLAMRLYTMKHTINCLLDLPSLATPAQKKIIQLLLSSEREMVELGMSLFIREDDEWCKTVVPWNMFGYTKSGMAPSDTKYPEAGAEKYLMILFM